MKPHKHAELIKAWADGAEIQMKNVNGVWIDIYPEWIEDCEYRITPESKLNVPDGLIDPKSYYQGYEDGKKYYLKKSPIGWIDEIGTFISAFDYKELHEKLKENMKPLYDIQEPKPDVVCFSYVRYEKDYEEIEWQQNETQYHSNVKLTFDGETGELKSAEVLK